VIVLLLILHGLVGVALLGAVTHQAVAVSFRPPAPATGFAGRYVRVLPKAFPAAVIVLFVANTVLGGVIYPTYRVDVRIPLEEMQLAWAVGVFEIKEHFGGIGLAMLPLYAWCWQDRDVETHADRHARGVVTWLLAFIVWFTFVSGHVINNLRGLGT
jgi:hypothetical protein